MLQGQPLFNDGREIGLWLELTPQAGSEQCGEVPEGDAVSGVVLSDQLKSLDWRLRQVKFIEPASSDGMAMVTSRVLAVLEPATPATLYHRHAPEPPHQVVCFTDHTSKGKLSRSSSLLSHSRTRGPAGQGQSLDLCRSKHFW